MIVKELIEFLSTKPQDMLILQRGYESGWNDISGAEIELVEHKPDGAWYDGEYQDVWYPEDPEIKSIEAVVIV